MTEIDGGWFSEIHVSYIYNHSTCSHETNEWSQEIVNFLGLRKEMDTYFSLDLQEMHLSRWLVGSFYDISTIIGYLMPNPFFVQINISISNNSVCQKHFSFKVFNLVKQFLFKRFIFLYVYILFIRSLMSIKFYFKQFSLV